MVLLEDDAEFARETSSVERISDDDFARHQWLQGRLTAALKAANDLTATWRVWGDELHERYGLARDGSEGVDPDGTIRRTSRKET